MFKVAHNVSDNGFRKRFSVTYWFATLAIPNLKLLLPDVANVDSENLRDSSKSIDGEEEDNPPRFEQYAPLLSVACIQSVTLRFCP